MSFVDRRDFRWVAGKRKCVKRRWLPPREGGGMSLLGGLFGGKKEHISLSRLAEETLQIVWYEPLLERMANDLKGTPLDIAELRAEILSLHLFCVNYAIRSNLKDFEAIIEAVTNAFIEDMRKRSGLAEEEVAHTWAIMASRVNNYIAAFNAAPSHKQGLTNVTTEFAKRVSRDEADVFFKGLAAAMATAAAIMSAMKKRLESVTVVIS